MQNRLERGDFFRQFSEEETYYLNQERYFRLFGASIEFTLEQVALKRLRQKILDTIDNYHHSLLKLQQVNLEFTNKPKSKGGVIDESMEMFES